MEVAIPWKKQWHALLQKQPLLVSLEWLCRLVFKVVKMLRLFPLTVTQVPRCQGSSAWRGMLTSFIRGEATLRGWLVPEMLCILQTLVFSSDHLSRSSPGFLQPFQAIFSARAQQVLQPPGQLCPPQEQATLLSPAPSRASRQPALSFPGAN